VSKLVRLVRCYRKVDRLCRGKDCEHARAHEPMTDLPDGTTGCTQPSYCPATGHEVRCVPHIKKSKKRKESQ
jgi:hypothetical protein